MLTLAEKEGRGGLTNNDSTDKMLKKSVDLIKYYIVLVVCWSFIERGKARQDKMRWAGKMMTLAEIEGLAKTDIS